MNTNSTRGRRPDATSKSGQIRSLLAAGASVADIAKKVGCSTNLVYNVKARVGGAGTKRGPGRPPKTAKPKAATKVAGLDGLGSILAAVQGAEQQRARLKRALEQIQQIVSAALN